MPFEEGESGNPAGRPKGAVNKVSKDLKEMIRNFLIDNFEEVQKCFDQLKAKEKVTVYCNMLSFVVPKAKRASDHLFDWFTQEELEKLREVYKEARKQATGS